MNRQSHWDRLYEGRSSPPSWHQDEPEPSLRWLRRIGMTPRTCVVDIGAGESRLIDRLLHEGLTCLAAVDVSEVALTRVRDRLGEPGRIVTWLRADVADPGWSLPPMNVWHDRAVFHFLTEADDRARYVEHVRRILVPDGHAIVATFAPGGPERCSELPVVRYSPVSLAREFGPDFQLIDQEYESHRTPAGVVQPFQWSVLVHRPQRSA